ncbi:HD domain-containing protein, partial [Candidatus Peregrinibacteria bacterium]|nr:HD domain-containing protein [Candidatus Peregrinibacteria bacterium]
MLAEERKYFERLKPFFEGNEKLFTSLKDHAAYLYEQLYRYSGESYLKRSLRITVDKILPLNPDLDMLVTSVLISACYSPRCDLKQIKKLFGKNVMEMVESLGKINSIKARYSNTDTNVIKKLFLALAVDLRVILIRLIDRIDNLETLEFKSEEKQKANAKEILDVYVPIASQLGLYEITLKLEDLAFKYVHPNEYHQLKKDINDYLSRSKASMEEVRKELESTLLNAGFNVEVKGRIKSVFSIYKKLKKKTRTLDKIYDIYAMRVILQTSSLDYDTRDDIEKIYAILSFLHSKYESLTDRFKDYVANPKKNGYQSLHTALLGLNSRDLSKPTEIQIRTDRMHNFAELGMAAHWLYKDAKGGKENLDKTFFELLNSLRQHLDVDHSRSASLKMDLYPDRIFVVTKDSLVKDLPKGATCVDFAYALDPEIGHTCFLAKVNGVAKSLDYELQNGDTVEILTDNKLSPKLSWLSFVKTKHAKNRIQNYFRSLDEENLLETGKQLLNKLLKELNMPLLDESLSFLRTYHGKVLTISERKNLLEDLGAGQITVNKVFEDCFGQSFET